MTRFQLGEEVIDCVKTTTRASETIEQMLHRHDVTDCIRAIYIILDTSDT